MTHPDADTLVDFAKRIRAAVKLSRQSESDWADWKDDLLGVADDLDVLAHPIVVVHGAPPRQGLCPVRPALDGSQGNPMAFCTFTAGHRPPHSWAKEQP